MINRLKQLIEIILPPSMQLFSRMLWYKISGKIDNEIIYADKILKKKRRFLDIGANVGVYSYFFSNKFKKIEAFEPLKEITYRLRALKKKNLKIHNIGLSNKRGNLKFYIPIIDGKKIPPLATLEKRPKPNETRNIKVKKLDNFNFKNVDLIKIDVEGHEYKLIQGAFKTIKRNNPLIICEIEQRHSVFSIYKTFKLIENLGYNGFFIKNGNLKKLNKFSYNKNQKLYLKDVENKNYINNFIFFPKKNMNKLLYPRII